MAKYLTLLYYKYARIENAEAFTAQHLAYCKSLGLVGRILIADEGINGSVSGTHERCTEYMNHLRSFDFLKGIEFKMDEEDELSFAKMHVRYKPEIVHLGVEGLDPNQKTAQHLKSNEVLEMLERDDVIFLDTRNKVEHEAGKFKNARTLDIETFRDFPKAVEQLEELKDKTIVAYCTGGIRCEKATSYMLQRGFKNVFQIEGGLIKYAKETGGKDFDGKLYVFDKRITVDINTVNPLEISKCRICGTTSTRMVNCANPECNEHFALCENCGRKMEGCCSQPCRENPRKRKYDGTGYYMKGINSKA